MTPKCWAPEKISSKRKRVNNAEILKSLWGKGDMLGPKEFRECLEKGLELGGRVKEERYNEPP